MSMVKLSHQCLLSSSVGLERQSERDHKGCTHETDSKASVNGWTSAAMQISLQGKNKHYDEKQKVC